MYLTQDKRGKTQFDCLLDGFDRLNLVGNVLLELELISEEDRMSGGRIAVRHSDRGSDLSGGVQGVHGRVDAVRASEGHESLLVSSELQHLQYNADKRLDKAWWPQGRRDFRDPVWQLAIGAYREVAGNPAYKVWATSIYGCALSFDERVNYNRFTTLLFAAEMLQRDVPGHPTTFREQLSAWLDRLDAGGVELTVAQGELRTACEDAL
eukprot:gene34750-33597_t